MADIFQDFPIKAPPDRVFQAVSTPEGLDCWWTQRSAGKPVVGADYELGFGPSCTWRAKATQCIPNTEFELEILCADKDWNHTRVGFLLEPHDDATQVQFLHTGWPSTNEHYRISSHCWAMYLRLLRRNLEHGEFIPYENRLEA
jgi:uncharacterized protein YndB with AHSA1/START domain